MNYVRSRLRQQTGQSIVFMAVLVLVLVAFAGMSIDTGNAMARQRRIQTASNTSSLSGANLLALNQTDLAVSEAIKKSFLDHGYSEANGNLVQVYGNFPVDAENTDIVYFRAQYLDKEGQPIVGDIGTQPSSFPRSRFAAFVQVKTSIDVNNTFAKVAGVPIYTVNARGIAGMDQCNHGIYPITFHQNELNTNRATPAGTVAEYTGNLDVDNSVLLTKRASTFVVERQAGVPGGFLWTQWDPGPGGGSTPLLKESMGGTGNIEAGFTEMPSPLPDYPNGPTPNQLEIDDWIPNNTGLVAAADDQLNYHLANRTEMILPLHNVINGTGASPGSGFRVSMFVKVRLLAYTTNGNHSTFTFILLQKNPLCAKSTDTPPPPPPQPPVVIGSLEEQLMWYKDTVSVGSLDIAIVQDYSYSMRFCWEKPEEIVSKCADPGKRRIDYALPVLNGFIQEMLVTRKAAGADNRLAYVKFGPGMKGQKVVNWTKDPNAFKTITGYNNPSFSMPNSELNNNTPTADGLHQAVLALNDGRKVDSNGQPVKLVVLLLTDGLTNVLFDGNAKGLPNRYDQLPFKCGKKQNPKADADMDNPLVQSTCPDVTKNYSGYGTGIRPPIQAMIDVANDARTNKNIVFYAVVLGAQYGLTPNQMGLGQVAPGKNYMADNPAALNQIITAVSQDMNRSCGVHSVRRIATGATATIRNTVTNEVISIPIDASGKFERALSPGNYTIEAYHRGVVAPEDTQFNIPRNYTRLTSPSVPEPTNNIPFQMPKDVNLDLSKDGPLVLVIDDYNNAKCP